MISLHRNLLAFWIYLFLSVFLSGLPLRTFANSEAPTEKLEVSLEELESGIREGLLKVSAFQAIKNIAKKYGVKAYLFGGTASSFGYYVSWDLRRKKGDTRYQAERFDYDYPNIYRSTQDTDIVIDGPPHIAMAMEAEIRAFSTELLGLKQKWEIRCLKHWRENKEPLLNDPQFQLQHSDSASVGLIEITDTAPSEKVIHDLRFWDHQDPPFARGLRNNRIFLYDSDKHYQTARFRAGNNPPILEALRFLTKAFQYDLTITSRDFQIVKKWIQDFDAQREVQNEYVRHKILEVAFKMMMNAINKTKAYQVINALELKPKIMSVIGQSTLSESIAALVGENLPSQVSYWLNRKPLAAYDVGQGTGKTAQSMGIQMVAHETQTYLAFEALTSSPTGFPNAFASREGSANEMAAYGEGFYTAVGREGARGTGLTVRYKVNPHAREWDGKSGDFFVAATFGLMGVGSGSYIVFLNQNALEVIPEFAALSLKEFVDRLVNEKWDHSDTGLMHRFFRHLSTDSSSLDLPPKEEEDLVQKIELLLERERPREEALLSSLNSLNLISGVNQHLFQTQTPIGMLRKIPGVQRYLKKAEAKRGVKKHEHATLVSVAENAMLWYDDSVADAVISASDDIAQKHLLWALKDHPLFGFDQSKLLSILNHPRATNKTYVALIEAILSQPTKQHDVVISALLGKKLDAVSRLAFIKHVLGTSSSGPWLKSHGLYLWKNSDIQAQDIRPLKSTFIEFVLAHPHSREFWTAWIDEFTNETDIFILRKAAKDLALSPQATEFPQFFDKLITEDDPVIDGTLKHKCPSLVSRLNR